MSSTIKFNIIIEGNGAAYERVDQNLGFLLRPVYLVSGFVARPRRRRRSFFFTTNSFLLRIFFLLLLWNYFFCSRYLFTLTSP